LPGSKPVVLSPIVHRALGALSRAASGLPGSWRLRHFLRSTSRSAFPDKPIRTRLKFGQALWVLPNDLIGRNIFCDGLWETPIAAHFYQNLRAGDVVLDIGANIGQYTVLAGSKVGPSGKVFAVEPSGLAEGLLLRNIRENRLTNVEILQLAAWDEDTTLFFKPGDKSNCGTAEVSKDPALSTSHQVIARRLDGVLEERGIARLDVVKIDIEGAELPALAGLTRTFERLRPRAIYCEVLGTPSTGRAAELIRFFTSRGFQAAVIGQHGPARFDPGLYDGDGDLTLLFS